MCSSLHPQHNLIGIFNSEKKTSTSRPAWTRRLVVVIGATEMQDALVILALSKDASYKLRATTRNLSSEAAKKLEAQGREVVAGDWKI
jgi:hypothetical protein